jgi:hypothetical protein
LADVWFGSPWLLAKESSPAVPTQQFTNILTRAVRSKQNEGKERNRCDSMAAHVKTQIRHKQREREREGDISLY